MTSLIQVVLLACFAVTVARCFAIPASYDQTPVLLTRNPDTQQLSETFLSHTNEEDERVPAIGQEASVFDHSTDAVPEKKAIEGLTKLKSGYSKVVSSQSSIIDAHTKHETSNRIQTRQPVIADSAKSSENAKESQVLVGLGHDIEDDDEEEANDTYAAEEISITPTANKSSMSAKDSLAIFMREHLYAASQSAPTSYGGQQPMAAKLTIDDDRVAATDEDEGKVKPGAEGSSSYAPLREEMERRLSDFVQKFMSGVLKAEVRVEERANGLQDYTAA